MYALSYGVGYHMLGPYFEAVLRQVRLVDSDACDEAIELRGASGPWAGVRRWPRGSRGVQWRVTSRGSGPISAGPSPWCTRCRWGSR